MGSELTTLARIRALSGFRSSRYLNDPIGTGDGSNALFSPRLSSMFISPTEDAPTLDEITVRENGTVVPVTAITENGVTLTTAPVDGAAITADYWGSNLSNLEVEAARSDAESEVFGKLVGMYSVDSLLTSVIVTKVISYLAAAALGDQAYNESGANTPGTVFPPDRLRRVAYNLLEQIVLGTLTLMDAERGVIPIVDMLDAWESETNYPTGRDRLFEEDPFNREDPLAGTYAEWLWNA